MHVPSFALFITVMYVVGIAPLLVVCAEQTWKHKIVVSQNDGIDNNACLNGMIPCKTLDYALQNATNSSLVLLRSATVASKGHQ